MPLAHGYNAATELRSAPRRIVEAALRERRRVARDIHDGAQQAFVNVLINLQFALQSWAADPTRAKDLVELATGEARRGIDELRELVSGMHPAILTTRGLGAAIESLAARHPVPTTLSLLDQRFAPEIEATGYFVVSEALANVAKHARASSACVRMFVQEGRLTLEVADDGIGGAAVGDNGTGLSGLADRLAALDGMLTINTCADRGTVLRGIIPIT